jgi:hypothetical protein
MENKESLLVGEKVREAYRTLLLPTLAEKETEVITLIKEYLNGLGISENDHSIWILLSIEDWKKSGEISSELKELINIALVNGDQECGEEIANVYYSLHSDFVEKSKLEHEESSSLLSFTGLIVRLASTQHMSSAQIAKVISSRYKTHEYHWKYVSKILAKLRIEPNTKINKELVVGLIERDMLMEEVIFADLGAEEAIKLVADISVSLGFEGNLEKLLTTLLDPNGKTFGPYLQILMYQCVIAEFSDHPLTTLYEFNPRGVVANYVFEMFPSSLEVSGNPILNNAKSVDRLDMAWAESKKDNQIIKAKALVNTIEGLEQMSFAARRELTSAIRKWILRLIRLNNLEEIQIDESITLDEIKKIVELIKSNETQTYGIIEQRLVDFLLEVKYSGQKEWRSRGLGDSVNASNVSRKKLGDCDYQNVDIKKVVAYEAHAGKLTNIYLKEHLRTLERVLELRKEEWLSISELYEWGVEVIFIVHDFSEEISKEEKIIINGLEVGIKIITFSEFIQDLQIDEQAVNIFIQNVIRPLNEKRTPKSVQERFLELLKNN